MCALITRGHAGRYTWHMPLLPSRSPSPSFLRSLPPSFNSLKRWSPRVDASCSFLAVQFPNLSKWVWSNRCAHHATREGSTSSAGRRCSSLFGLYLGHPMSTTISTAKRIIWGKRYSASLPHSSSVSFSSVSKSLSYWPLIPPARLL